MYISNNLLYMILSKTSIDIRIDFKCFGKISHDIEIPLKFNRYDAKESGIYISICNGKKYHIRRLFNNDGSFDSECVYSNEWTNFPTFKSFPDVIYMTRDFSTYIPSYNGEKLLFN